MRRRRLVEGRKFAVDRVEVPVPGGGTVERELVVHPGAVAILPVLDDGRFVLIRNRRFAVGRTLLEVPAGTLEPGEDPGACASRELAEETGYRARRLAPLLAFHTSPGFCDEVMFAYLATGLTPGDAALEEGEDIEVTLLAPADAFELARTGGITDGKTLTVLHHHRAFGAVERLVFGDRVLCARDLDRS
jgi:8-oxo-dGTP pyrophosphatase MutT (NUDIX family)